MQNCLWLKIFAIAELHVDLSPLPSSVMISIDKNDLGVYLDDGEMSYYFINCDDKECQGKNCENPHTSPTNFDLNTSMPIKCQDLKPNHVYSVTVGVGSFKVVKQFTSLGKYWYCTNFPQTVYFRVDREKSISLFPRVSSQESIQYRVSTND